MTSIITGDIINSRKLSTADWLPGLTKILNTKGKSPEDWQLYRGDEFQLEIKQPEEALMTALEIKAFLKTLKLDARMSIGIGEKEYKASKITESNGPAFIRSGEVFEKLKKNKITLAINTGNATLDMDINLVFKLATSIMNHWLPQSAEFVLEALHNRTLSQQQLGERLGITQAAISRRHTRSQFDLIIELDAYYRQKIKQLIQ